jgi:hypothetical protein
MKCPNMARSGQNRSKVRRSPFISSRATRQAKRRSAMTYRIMTWAAVAWIAIWLTPYLYAVNDLITWR